MLAVHFITEKRSRRFEPQSFQRWINVNKMIVPQSPTKTQTRKTKRDVWLASNVPDDSFKLLRKLGLKLSVVQPKPLQ